MLTKKITAIVKQSVFAAILLATAGNVAIAAQPELAVIAAKKPDTILVPMQGPVGCWTDEGYGRFSSCDAG